MILEAITYISFVFFESTIHTVRCKQLLPGKNCQVPFSILLYSRIVTNDKSRIKEQHHDW
jgi:hypothetical protein